MAELEKEEFAEGFKTLLGTVFEVRQEMVNRNQSCPPEKAAEIENQLNQLLAIAINREKKPETARFQRSMIK